MHCTGILRCAQVCTCMSCEAAVYDVWHICLRLSTGVSCQSLQGRRYQRTYSGTASSEDVVVASARAYVGALNKVIG